MKQLIRIICVLTCMAIFAVQSLQAQDLRSEESAGILFNFSYASQFPGGDLSERFGNNPNIGLGVDFITKKTNYIFGLEGNIMFGTNVKENVLLSLLTPEGNLIGNDRSFAEIRLAQRGFYVGALVGKLFSLSQTNNRSGIRVTVGSGILQHKIRIQDDPIRDVAPLADDYKKGYDRLTNGLAFNEFVGYQHLGKNRRINFYAGLEFTQAFTRSRRDFNFDTRMADTENRFDLLIGIRLGWILPFYIGDSSQIYY